EKKEMAGVPVAVVTPPVIADQRRSRVLLNIHGGAFIYGEGMHTEAIVAAHWGNIKVISVDYRTAPDHPFPAVLEDTVAVYRELLKSYSPKQIAIYGSSAGGTFTATTILKLRDLGLPLPAAAGILTPATDLSQRIDGDSTYVMEGVDLALSGWRSKDSSTGPSELFYGAHDPTDPLISPIFGDYSRGFCPSYFLAGTRDFLLSATVMLHRKMHSAGVPCELHVFEAMWHGFNVMAHLPEAREATTDLMRFFDRWMEG
ncbi:MAG: alpha/beta hydrolase, partial [Steroidobacteraceae bacterium]